MVVAAIEEKVFLVKFDCGYYASKQPRFEWSFTDDPLLAHTYETRKAAEERGEWGISKASDPRPSYEIEAFLKTTTLRKIKEQK